MSELQGLQSRIADFGNTAVVAISPDSVEQNTKVIQQLGLTFPILSDSSLEATDAFGLRHADASPYGGDLPRPATYIVDAGTVRWRRVTDNWRVRPRPDDILRILATTD